MEDTKYASRAGEKLKFALEKFKISAKELTCADFGSSTGGFVDCLLQSNAMHVALPEKADLIAIDVGWTKQESILPNAFANLKANGKIVSLIKPHYESPKYFLRKGKLPDEKMDEVLDLVSQKIEGCGGKILKIVESPILGEKGKNREFLALIVRRQEA